MRAAIVIALVATGLAFSLSGVVGILRMPDLYCRIQCSTKTITMGALPVLVAVAVGEGPVTPYGSRALLVAVLLLVLNPASSHALARAAYKVGVPMWSGAVRDDARAERDAREKKAKEKGRDTGTEKQGGAEQGKPGAERGGKGSG